jgi:4-amino-4-deoxy-L-arabinose transferase-like glycosyltransferase
MRRTQARVAVAALTGIGLLLRLWNLRFGLPDWYHPDEPMKADIVVAMMRGEWHPQYFYHPSFMLYAAVVVRRFLSIGENDAQAAVFAGRLTTALLGAATIPLTYVAGCLARGRWAGVAAAALLAIAPLHVVCSHYLKEDVPMTFWAVAAVAAALAMAGRGRRRDYALAGLCAGLCAGTKYTGFLFWVLPWLAHRERTAHEDAGRRGPSMRWAVGGAVAGFLVATPYAVLDPGAFLFGVGHESGNVAAGRGGVTISPLPYLWTFHLRYSIVPGFGLLPTFLAGAGLVAALRRATPAARLLSATVIGVYSVIENSPFKPPPNFDRYAVPLVPFLALLAADAVLALRRRLGERLGRRTAIAGTALCSLAIGIGPAIYTARLDAAMATDTRAAARAWLMAHTTARERVLLEGALNARGKLVPSYVPALPADRAATYCYSLGQFADRLADYDLVVASSFMYDRYLHLGAEPRDRRQFYETLFGRHELAAEFHPAVRSYGFHNPTIRIYRVRSPSGPG